MSKYVKGLLQGQIEQRIDDNHISEFMIVNMMGIGGNDANAMRGELLKKGIRLFVVKNSLFRKALANKEMGAAGEMFSGPCTLAYGGDSIVDLAKEIVDWKKKIKVLDIKGAYLEGSILDQDGAVSLSKMPTRMELLSTLAGTVLSPARNVAGAVMSPASTIAGCLKTIIEKAEKAA